MSRYRCRKKLAYAVFFSKIWMHRYYRRSRFLEHYILFSRNQPRFSECRFPQARVRLYRRQKYRADCVHACAWACMHAHIPGDVIHAGWYRTDAILPARYGRTLHFDAPLSRHHLAWLKASPHQPPSFCSLTTGLEPSPSRHRGAAQHNVVLRCVVPPRVPIFLRTGTLVPLNIHGKSYPSLHMKWS